MKILKNNRFLIARRIVQLTILFLFGGSNWWGWKILIGNLSAACIADKLLIADPFAVIQTIASGYIVSSSLFYGALIVLLFYFSIAGRSFCSWVCPMNIVTESTAFLYRKLNLKELDWKIKVSSNVRYWIIVLALLLSTFFGIAAFELVSPIGILHRGIIFGIGVGWLAVLAIVFFDLFILKNGWCGYFCPLGAFYSLLGKYNLIKVRHKVESCTKCMKCFVVCPEKQVLTIIGKNSGCIVSGECINCGKCIEVCEDDALKFSINNYKTKNNER